MTAVCSAFSVCSIFLRLACLSAIVLGVTPQTGYAQNEFPPNVAAVRQGDGWRLTDSRGMTLYLYESDEQGSGKSTCNAACAKARPPLTAASDVTKLPADWSLITRDGGQRQWSFKGKPVYTFVRDAYVGATFGEGDGWRLAFLPIPMPPGIMLSKTLMGQVLASATGMTLYTRGNITKKSASTGDGNKIDCQTSCLETWFPVAAPWMAEPIGEFSVMARDDGLSQWGFRGLPLYLYLKDTKPGDTKGEGVDHAWATALLEPAAPYPSWVKVLGSDGGELLADPKGMTIYAYDEDRNKLVYVRGEDCSGPCIESSWAPVKADAQVPPIGNWSVVKNEDGSLQWSYQGKPLYTSKLETRPGDLSGIMLRRSRAWRPIMRSLPSLQGASPNG